jgi:hypothetical protein
LRERVEQPSLDSSAVPFEDADDAAQRVCVSSKVISPLKGAK